MNCSNCKQEMSLSLEFTGGCQGHGPDEYCYCDSVDVHVEAYCTNPKCKLRRERQDTPGLTDQYSIARWINDRYGTFQGAALDAIVGEKE